MATKAELRSILESQYALYLGHHGLGVSQYRSKTYLERNIAHMHKVLLWKAVADRVKAVLVRDYGENWYFFATDSKGEWLGDLYGRMYRKANNLWLTKAE